MPLRLGNHRSTAIPAWRGRREFRPVARRSGAAPAPKPAMLSDRAFLRLALTSPGLAIVSSFTLAVRVVGAADRRDRSSSRRADARAMRQSIAANLALILGAGAGAGARAARG